MTIKVCTHLLVSFLPDLADASPYGDNDEASQRVIDAGDHQIQSC